MKFSIITCTYNAGRVLQRTLNSVMEQSHADIQHIIIDGDSTDNTMEVVAEYQNMVEGQHLDGRSVIVVSENDEGLYDAMNKGLALMDGDYVLFLNAGDRFHCADTLKVVAECIASLPEGQAGVAYGDTNVVDAANHYVGKRRHCPPETLSWHSFEDGMLVCHQAFYANTKIARKVHYNLKYQFSADVDWCIRVMKEAELMALPLVNTHEVLCDFLTGGMSIKNHRKSLMERFWIMTRHYGLCNTIKKHFEFMKKGF